MNTLTVGELKDILKDVSDDTEIVLVSEEIPTNVVRVTQVGYLISDYEDHDALGFASLSDIKEVTGMCQNYLFDGRNKDEIEEIS